MTPEAQKLLEEIGRGMLKAAPDTAWTRLELQLSGAGLMTETSLGVAGPDGVLDWRHEIDDATLVKCDVLREVMHQEGTGTWYNARLTVDREGQFESEFDYDNPPLDGHADPELLEEDQQEYPRDQKHLPDWHPSKSAT